MNKTIENKIDILIEEASYRDMNLALRLKSMTPKQLTDLNSATGKLKIAGKGATNMLLPGAIGGSIGGGLIGGLPGAAIGGTVMAGAIGLGAGIGEYLNASSMSNMTSEEISSHIKAAEATYGTDTVKEHIKRLSQ